MPCSLIRSPRISIVSPSITLEVPTMVCAEARLQVATRRDMEARMRSTVSYGSLLKGIERVVLLGHARKHVNNATASIRGIKALPAQVKVWTEMWAKSACLGLRHWK